MRGYRSQWFLHKMNNRHPLQMKKWKSWEPFGSYQLNSTANPAQNLKIGPRWPKRQSCLAGSSQMAPRILIFSIAMGADYSFYLKTIETHARAFFKVIIFSIDSVYLMRVVRSKMPKKHLMSYVNAPLVITMFIFTKYLEYKYCTLSFLFFSIT